MAALRKSGMMGDNSRQVPPPWSTRNAGESRPASVGITLALLSDMKTIILSKSDMRGYGMVSGAKFAVVHNNVVWAAGRTEASCLRDFKRGCKVAGTEPNFGDLCAIVVLP